MFCSDPCEILANSRNFPKLFLFPHFSGISDNTFQEKYMKNKLTGSIPEVWHRLFHRKEVLESCHVTWQHETVHSWRATSETWTGQPAAETPWRSRDDIRPRRRYDETDCTSGTCNHHMNIQTWPVAGEPFLWPAHSFGTSCAFHMGYQCQLQVSSD